MGIKNFAERMIPRYARIPLITVLCVNFLAYFVTRLISRDLTHYDLSLPLDKLLPFWPIFVVPYMLAYLQWIVGYILIGREGRLFCYRFLTGEIIAKLMCLVLFLALPTTMVRAEITGADIFSRAVGYIYSADAADNLFPSIHCLESWVCFRSALQMKRVGKPYRYISLAATLLVFASTVLIKQHLVVDIAAGIAVVEIGLFISKMIWRKSNNEKI